MGEIRGMWMNVEELAAALGYSLKTVYKMRSIAPHRLPPSMRLPGSRRVVWMTDDVRAWLLDQARKEVV